MKYMKIWWDIIEAGQNDGTIRSDLPPKHIAQIIQIYITGVLDQMVLVKRALE
ncbi:hypothetical protein E2P71_00170 [Candidatus Bathyarchaeota archaeon]|nr:hypothetical protein E2P71_00170 [Candidatus Bathyarchaeota archaeon]